MFKIGQRVKLKGRRTTSPEATSVAYKLRKANIPLDTIFTVRLGEHPTIAGYVNLSMEIDGIRELGWNSNGSGDCHYWVKNSEMELATAIFVGGE